MHPPPTFTSTQFEMSSFGAFSTHYVKSYYYDIKKAYYRCCSIDGMQSVSESVSELIIQSVSEWVIQWVSEWVSHSMSQWVRESIHSIMPFSIYWCALLVCTQ